MRALRISRLSLCAAAAAGALAVTAPAVGSDIVARYRLRRLSDATTLASPPFTPPADAPDCNPALPGIPDLIGPDFDPGAWDQIEVAGDSRFVAYATRLSAGAPGSRALVVLREGADPTTVTGAGGDDDQPSLQFDFRGWRMAFRGSQGSAGESNSDIWLHTSTRAGDDAGDDTVNLTELDLTKATATDPALCARTPYRDFGSGVELRVRDARVAFVSTAFLDPAHPAPTDENGVPTETSQPPQLFVWDEQDARFRQLTRNDDEFSALSRPTISGDGRSVAFESSADLVPGAANPLDAAQVGNPDGVRQIYLWRETATGGRITQLTWSDRDCLAPRITPNGRTVLFCSRGDLLPGGNPEANFELFRWRRGSSRFTRLAQLTQTTTGDSVFPRPLGNSSRCVFFSTVADSLRSDPFGASGRQCLPSAFLWTPRGVRLVRGVDDLENIALIADGPDADDLPDGFAILTGPPAAASASKVQFVANDPALDPPGDVGHASQIVFHLARATRYARSR